jgi:non-ribosomal peptide synthetase component F
VVAKELEDIDTESAAAVQSITGMLAEQVANRPDDTAAVHRDTVLTYRELDARSAALAGRLVAAGAGPDTCVGVYAEPSLDLMTGVWGVLRSGAAYLPLSPDYPDERLRYMLEDSRTAVVVAQPHLRDRLERLAPAGTTVVTAADAQAHAARRPDRPDLARPRPRHLAYVIYTSGSTGRP